jgi:RNA recognition motif-containing protein
MVGTKVFVGNLAFKTTEADLAKAFEEAGKVLGANIITRGTQSLGYGFVELSTEEEAQEAVKLLDKKELDGRAINVELARPREETERRSNGQNRRFIRRGGFRGRGGRRGFRGGFRNRRRYDRRNYQQQQEEEEERQSEEEEDQRPRRQQRRYRNNYNRNSRNYNRRPRDNSNRVDSKTTLFVFNLPFALDDEGFAKVLQESGIQFKSVRIARYGNRSKGFGFVEFDNEQDQKKALEVLDKKVVNGRELSVKIAWERKQEQSQQ